MNVVHGMNVTDSTRQLLYLDGQDQIDGISTEMPRRRTMSSLSALGFRCVNSNTLPLSNHGIATAGIDSVDDVKDQMGHKFGWFNVDHLSSTAANVWNEEKCCQ